MTQYNIENSDNTLTGLLATVQELSNRQQDYLADTGNLQFHTTAPDEGPNQSHVIIEAEKGAPTTQLRVNDVAFDQIASKADIPVKTARRLRDQYPDVLDHAMREIWDKESETRMVRTYLDGVDERSGVARAFVSDRFKTFDNVHLLEAALPQLIESEAQYKVVRAEVTDKRMYIQLKSEVITADVAARDANPLNGDTHSREAWGGQQTRVMDGVNRAVGDVMALGIGFSNSEVGHGSLSVQQMYFTLACLNGMITERGYRKAHLGGKHDLDDEVVAILQADTVEAMNRALALKLRDLVADYSRPDAMEEIVTKFHQAHDRLVNVEPQKAVERLGAVLKLTKPQTSSVLDGLMQTLTQAGYAGRPVSQATLVNAVTAVQHRVDEDDRNDWQKLGGKVLDLPESQWHEIAKAA